MNLRKKILSAPLKHLGCSCLSISPLLLRIMTSLNNYPFVFILPLHCGIFFLKFMTASFWHFISRIAACISFYVLLFILSVLNFWHSPRKVCISRAHPHFFFDILQFIYTVSPWQMSKLFPVCLLLYCKLCCQEQFCVFPGTWIPWTDK